MAVQLFQCSTWWIIVKTGGRFFRKTLTKIYTLLRMALSLALRRPQETRIKVIVFKGYSTDGPARKILAAGAGSFQGSFRKSLAFKGRL